MGNRDYFWDFSRNRIDHFVWCEYDQWNYPDRSYEGLYEKERYAAGGEFRCKKSHQIYCYDCFNGCDGPVASVHVDRDGIRNTETISHYDRRRFVNLSSAIFYSIACCFLLYVSKASQMIFFIKHS